LKSRALTYLLVFVSGIAALSWEVLWQIRASLAIGVSAMGAAITLAATMGGMTMGALTMGRILQRRAVARPLRVYGTLEVVIGLAGLVFLPGFALLERIDGALFLRAPTLVSLAHLAGMMLVLGLPTFAMGATVPVFGLMARASRTSIAALYGINTAGAAIGVLLVSFGLLPRLGVELTAMLMTGLNLVVALITWLVRATPALEEPEEPPADAPDAPTLLPSRVAGHVAFLTGFVSFGLEVTWFRTLRASYRSTTDAFAVMLVSVLVPLAFGASLGAWLRGRRVSMGSVIAAAGAAILLVTPLVERLDWLGARQFRSVWSMCLAWIGGSLPVLGLPMVLLGACLPWLLKDHAAPASWGRLYAINTMGAVAGSLTAAWILLPTLGFARSAWLLGAVVVVASLFVPSFEVSWRRLVPGAVALAIAVVCESGAGRKRVIGDLDGSVAKIVRFEEGVDSTLAVAENAKGERLLYIDGLVATSETRPSHYMAWMGRLPMLVHPAPKRALVICFGTGQTANAVRQENPESLDIVELSAAVLRSAPLFLKNEGVLDDPRVHVTVMDGRAWLRRTDHVYDVVTLEPMPPNFAGVNALYSREFYELVASRLADGGVATQWLPFHLLSIHDAVAIVTTFQSVFQDSFVWVDPVSTTGIVVGRRGDGTSDVAHAFPGLRRPSSGRDLTPRQILGSVILDPQDVARLAQLGDIVTDDNQMLAYGRSRYRLSFVPTELTVVNLTLLRKVREERPAPP
jgi:spermidine synthase